MRTMTRTYNQVAGQRNVCGRPDRAPKLDFKSTKAAISEGYRRMREAQWPLNRGRVKFIPKQ